MKQRIRLSMLLLTFIMGGAGMAVWYLLFMEGNYFREMRFLTTGAFFSFSLVFGLVGVFLAEYLHRKKFHVVRQGKRVVSLILAAILGMAVGAGGQFLYAFTYTSHGKENVDIILLLDGSDSMEENWDSCIEAACEFIDQTEETTRVQVTAFASLILGSTELLVMDEAGKEQAKEFIQKIDIKGGTDFEIALSDVLSCLEETENRQERKQTVVMVTDGQAEISSEIQDKYLQEGIAFYSIQFYFSKADTAEMDKMTAFAEATGGFDTRLERNTDGKVGIQEMKKAFDRMYAGVREISQSDVWLNFGGITENTIWRFGIRMLFFGLFTVLTGFVYYQRQTKLQVLANLATGCVTAALVTLSGNLSEKGGMMAAMVLMDVLLVSAWSSCSLEPGKNATV